MPNTGVLVVLAVIPAVILMIYIYAKDKVEKEPIGMLVGLFFLGALTIFGAAGGEYAIQEALVQVLDEKSVAFNFVFYFFGVALCEEGMKFLVLRTRTWKSPNFNYTFDAIVYAVVISLGFATFENIMYVVDSMTYELAFWRGILSVPGHAIDAVFMGVFYGKAKYFASIGDMSGKSRNMALAFFVPLATHGFYDFCLSLQGEFEQAMLLFFGFVIITTIAAIINVHTFSKKDTAIPGMGVPFYQMPGYNNGYNNTYAQQTYPQSNYQPYNQPYQQQGYAQPYNQPYQQQGYAQPYNQPYQQQGYAQTFNQPYQQPYNNGNYFTPNGYTQAGSFNSQSNFSQPRYDANGRPIYNGQNNGLNR